MTLHQTTRYDWNTIRNQIISERKRQGLSQEELAERAGYSRQTVGAVERDENHPSLEFLLRTCNALHCDIGYILKEPGYENGRTRESIDVQEATGLTEAAADELIRIHSLDMNHRFPGSYYERIDDFLSAMIVDTDFRTTIYAVRELKDFYNSKGHGVFFILPLSLRQLVDSTLDSSWPEPLNDYAIVHGIAQLCTSDENRGTLLKDCLKIAGTDDFELEADYFEETEISCPKYSRDKTAEIIETAYSECTDDFAADVFQIYSIVCICSYFHAVETAREPVLRYQIQQGFERFVNKYISKQADEGRTEK